MARNPAVPLKNHNPLSNRALTLEEYAGLTREARSKAAWLLKDHIGQLDAEMTETRLELEAELERREAEMGHLNHRIKQLTTRRARAVKTIRTQLAEIPELQLLAASTTGLKVDLADATDAVTAFRTLLAKTVAEDRRLRGLVARAEERIKARQVQIEGHLPTDDEGARRRMEADNEIMAFRARKTRERAEAAGTPLRA
jgi:chromosome segregation ATPase